MFFATAFVHVSAEFNHELQNFASFSRKVNDAFSDVVNSCASSKPFSSSRLSVFLIINAHPHEVTTGALIFDPH